MTNQDATILIRPEQPALTPAIHAVHAAAFGRPDEADLVDALRAAEAFSPKLSLMALFDGQVVGHALYTPMTLEPAADDLKLVALGPIGVLPDYQRQFIGGALIYEGFEVCRRMKYDALFLLGDPAYYGRFGYQPAADYGLRCAYDPSGVHFMAYELRPDALSGLDAEVRYHPLFDGV